MGIRLYPWLTFNPIFILQSFQNMVLKMLPICICISMTSYHSKNKIVNPLYTPPSQHYSLCLPVQFCPIPHYFTERPYNTAQLQLSLLQLNRTSFQSCNTSSVSRHSISHMVMLPSLICQLLSSDLAKVKSPILHPTEPRTHVRHS